MLPVFWSNGAFLLQPWLSEAVRLLTEDSFAFDRDFLLPLPKDGGLTAASRRRAPYSDSAAFSQSLWASLVDAEGEALLPRGSGVSSQSIQTEPTLTRGPLLLEWAPPSEPS